MLYEYGLTIPANTSKSAPVSAEVPVSPGRLVRVLILFPLGHRGYTHAWIQRGEHRLFPSDPEETFVGDGHIIDWPEDYVLDDIPYTFKVYGYNDDDSYQHTIYFHFAIIPLVAVGARAAAGGWLAKLKEALT